MAVIDTFLKLLIVQRAEKLVLIPDEIPTVVKGDESIELPMPAVPIDLVKRLSVEVVGEQFTGHSLEGTYCTADGEQFTYAVRCNESDCRIELQTVETEMHHEREAEGPDLPKACEARRSASDPASTLKGRSAPSPEWPPSLPHARIGRLRSPSLSRSSPRPCAGPAG